MPPSENRLKTKLIYKLASILRGTRRWSACVSMLHAPGIRSTCNILTGEISPQKSTKGTNDAPKSLRLLCLIVANSICRSRLSSLR